MKNNINVFEHAANILQALGKGILFTTMAEGKINTMTIGWGLLGIEWGMPVFTAFIREGRYTRKMLEKNPQFTINVPTGPYDRKIIGVAGTKSGRDVDKIELLGLHTVQPEIITVPGIRELPLTLECTVIYSQLQDRERIPHGIREDFYPPHLDYTHPGCNRDYHIAFYGKIEAAYIIGD